MGPGTTHSAVVSTRCGRATKTAVAVFAALGGRLSNGLEGGTGSGGGKGQGGGVGVGASGRGESAQGGRSKTG